MALSLITVFLLLLLSPSAYSNEEKDLETVNKALDVTNACLNAFTSLPVIGHLLEPFAALGGLVQSMFGIFGRKGPDPVMVKLGELGEKFDRLSYKLSQEFNELKAFITEHNFYSQVAGGATTLARFMEDVIRDPNNQTVAAFRNVCAVKSPMILAYDLLSLLDPDSTNPLKMVMNGDRLKTKATFEKWRQIIENVMRQFIFIESFRNGLFGGGDLNEAKILTNHTLKLLKTMDGWREDYRRKDYFWPTGIQEYVEDIQVKYESHSNEQIAHMIKTGLSGVLTDSSFYIIVYDGCDGYGEHGYNAIVDQIVYSFRKGEKKKKTNVVVFRSDLGDRDNGQLRSEVTAVANGCKKCRNMKMDRFPEIMMNTIDNGGFVGVIKRKHNVALKWVTPSGREPGFHTTDACKCDRFLVVAGFR